MTRNRFKHTVKRFKHTVKSVVIVGALTTSLCGSVFAATTADHNSKVNWDQGYRYITADTQAYYVSGNGTKVKVGSYTRCRFERAWWQGGGSYGDSGRCWSTGTGKSKATSGKEKYDFLDSGVAKSYWGTE